MKKGEGGINKLVSLIITIAVIVLMVILISKIRVLKDIFLKLIGG
ncbi:MAG: hypothetical protein AABY07_09700 [Nanoarchaeota archaeon]